MRRWWFLNAGFGWIALLFGVLGARTVVADTGIAGYVVSRSTDRIRVVTDSGLTKEFLIPTNMRRATLTRSRIDFSDGGLSAMCAKPTLGRLAESFSLTLKTDQAEEYSIQVPASTPENEVFVQGSCGEKSEELLEFAIFRVAGIPRSLALAEKSGHDTREEFPESLKAGRVFECVVGRKSGLDGDASDFQRIAGTDSFQINLDWVKEGRIREATNEYNRMRVGPVSMIGKKWADERFLEEHGVVFLRASFPAGDFVDVSLVHVSLAEQLQESARLRLPLAGDPEFVLYVADDGVTPSPIGLQCRTEIRGAAE